MLLLLMIVAIVCVLFANKIDVAVKGNRKVKKVIIIFSVLVLLFCATGLAIDKIYEIIVQRHFL